MMDGQCQDDVLAVFGDQREWRKGSQGVAQREASSIARNGKKDARRDRSFNHSSTDLSNDG